MDKFNYPQFDLGGFDEMSWTSWKRCNSSLCGCGKSLCDECRIILGGKNYCRECADKLVSESQRPRMGVSQQVETEEGLDILEAILICLFSPLAV